MTYKFYVESFKVTADKLAIKFTCPARDHSIEIVVLLKDHPIIAKIMETAANKALDYFDPKV